MADADSDLRKEIFLVSSMQEKVGIPFDSRHLSEVINTLTEHDYPEMFPIEFKVNYSTEVLTLVSRFLSHYIEENDPMTDFDIPLKSDKVENLVQKWYADFVQQIHPRPLLFSVVLAANYLQIQPLLKLCCLAIAVDITGRSVNELNEIFNIHPDDEAEKESVKKENEWAVQALADYKAEEARKTLVSETAGKRKKSSNN